LTSPAEKAPSQEEPSLAAQAFRRAQLAGRIPMRLAEFFRASWSVLEAATPLDDNWHIDAMADHVEATLLDWWLVQQWRQAALRGLAVEAQPVQRIQNLIINVPPGTAKSRLVSVCAPAWMWTICPAWRAIFISGNPRVSTRDSMLCRDLIRSDWYQETFKPAWRLAIDQDAKTLFKNTAGGSRLAIGAKAKITGDRADALFVDDANDAADVESDAERDAVNTWWDNGAGNRVNDLRTSVRIVIQQRLHEDDFTGHVLSISEWFHLILPMEYEVKPACECACCKRAVNPLGWRDPRTTAGELLFPRRFTPEVLAAELRRLGTMGYDGQYQQRPSAKGGLIFKDEWFTNRYKRLPPLVEVWTTWDTALKAKEHNDESACVTAGKGDDGDVYILRMAHGRWETPDLANFLIAQAYYYRRLYGAKYRGDYVEDKQSGTTLMQYVKRHEDPDRAKAEDGKALALIGIQVDGDKEARAKGVSPLCETGRVRLPDIGIFPSCFEWIRDLTSQLTKFPKAKNDDIVDAFVYTLKKFLGTLGGRKSRRGKRGGPV
jgi:predicted phage terminase large subunit-like protein